MPSNLIARDSLIGMVAGPLVWAAHFLTCYVLVAVVCAFSFDTVAQAGWGTVQTVLVIVTAVALAVIAGLTFLASRRWRQSGGSEPPAGDVQSRHRFMAVSAVLLCILSGVSVIYVAVPLFLLPVCQ